MEKSSDANSSFHWVQVPAVEWLNVATVAVIGGAQA